MRASFAGLAVLLAVLFALAATEARADDEPVELPARGSAVHEGTAWERRLTDALRRSAEEGKPVLALCHFSLAPASKHLVEKVYTDSDLAEDVASKFVPLLLDGDALDSAESGTGALSRFSVSFFPMHLVLDADGRILATVRGSPGTTPTRVRGWLTRLDRDVRTCARERARVEAAPDDAEARLAWLQTRLDLATRLANLEGGWVAEQPPASAHHRQIDVVIEEAEAGARALGRAEGLAVDRAWAVWASACLAGGRHRAQALERIDAILARETPDAVYVAFNTAYALFEADPEAALPYLRHVISMGPSAESYWQARAYEAYALGRLDRLEEAKDRYRALIAEGPAEERWVQWAKGHLQRVEAWERRQAAKEQEADSDGE